MTKKNQKVEKANVVVEPHFIEKYAKMLGIGVGAVVLVVLLVMGYKHFISEPKAAAANDAIPATQTLLEKGDSASVAAVAKSAQGVADDFSGTDAANLAHLYAGISLYNQGKYQEALDELEDYSGRGDQNVTPAVYAAKGDCQACLKKYDEAVKSFEKAASKAGHENLKVMYLIKAGEICEFALKDNAKALAFYQQAEACKASYQAQSGMVQKYIERVSVK